MRTSDTMSIETLGEPKTTEIEELNRWIASNAPTRKEKSIKQVEEFEMIGIRSNPGRIRGLDGRGRWNENQRKYLESVDGFVGKQTLEFSGGEGWELEGRKGFQWEMENQRKTLDKKDEFRVHCPLLSRVGKLICAGCVLRTPKHPTRAALGYI